MWEKLGLRQFMHKLSVPQIMVLGFLVTIAVATILLWLPVATAEGSTRFIDAFFTAVSAVCVTGLSVVNTATHWSLFGQIVILVTAQVGALGFMTFIALIFLFLGKRITLKERMLIQQSFNQTDLTGMVRLVVHVVSSTLVMEAVSAVILATHFMQMENIGFGRALWYGVFHAVSAFCGSGFVIIGQGSLSKYVNDPIVNITIMLLVISGSLGYAVWMDMIRVFRELTDKRLFFQRISLHSRIVLEMTLGLILFGAVFFLLCEFNNPDTMGRLSWGGKILASFFQSVTPRTLGLYTLDQHALNYNAKLMTTIFMFIGGSPGSTCGGIKTVTLAVIAASVHSVIKGRDSIILHKRKITVETLQKALSVVCVYIFIVVIAVLALTFTEGRYLAEHEFFDLLFESVSATATVGLSFGLTNQITDMGKIILMLCMFLGRIGGITVAISLSSKNSFGSAVRYPEAKLIVG